MIILWATLLTSGVKTFKCERFQWWILFDKRGGGVRGTLAKQTTPRLSNLQLLALIDVFVILYATSVLQFPNAQRSNLVPTMPLSSLLLALCIVHVPIKV